VLDGREGLADLPAHRLSRAIRRDQLGVRFLDLAELAYQAIVLRVGNFGAILDVVEIVVAVEGLAECLSPFGRVLRHGGAQDSMPHEGLSGGATCSWLPR